MDDIKQALEWAGWQKKFLSLLPCSCMICQRPGSTLLCDRCLQELHHCEDPCEQCGEKLPVLLSISPPLAANHCGNCITRPPPFNRTIFAYRYAGPIVQLIQQFKFNEALILSKLLADMIINSIASHHQDYALPDALIPIPLHPTRLKQRGFNQSLELAKHLGKALGIPVSTSLLIRTRATPNQSGLNRKARERNIKGAFTISTGTDQAALAGKHLALVDDVITTGSTAREAAKALKQAKPAQISLMVVAKTQFQA